MTNESEKLINDFIEEIKKNLPDWIKNDDEKIDDIVLEISSHVWDSAYEIAESDNPDLVSIQKAIIRLGSAKEIAKSYKTRGTPKYFISEELWPNYQKTVGTIVAIIFPLILILQLALFEPNNFIQALINSVTLSYTSITLFIIIVTMIFIYFSTEGYFPGDFDYKTSQQIKKESEFYKPGDFLGSGIASILFGLFIIFLPVEMLNLFRLILYWILGFFNLPPTIPYSDTFVVPSELFAWFLVVGLVSLFAGLISLMKIQSRNPEYQMSMNVLYVIAKLGDLATSLFIVINLHLIEAILPVSRVFLIIMMFLAIMGNFGEIFGAINKNVKLYRYMEEKNKSSTR